MKILFVPYLTDTQNAYTRVRACAAARAIENECYVAIAGCVGNLPGVSNMDIQFGQVASIYAFRFCLSFQCCKRRSHSEYRNDINR